MTAPRRIQNANHRQKAYQADMAIDQAPAEISIACGHPID